MSSKYWLLFGLLALGAAQSAACSSKFKTCEVRRTCPSGGASGTLGAAGAPTDGGETGEGGEGGSGEGGTGGVEAQTGQGGVHEDAGAGGMAGGSDSNAGLEITQPTLLDAGKTYVPFTGSISASGAAHYKWSVASGTLPAGLALQGAKSATVTIAGTPTEAGQFPISLSVTDGSTTKTVDVKLVITHPALFLSDRRLAGVNELFLAEIGGDSPSEPVQLSATLPSGGGISDYAWSPDGSKVLYVAKQSSGGAAELWVASLASPGTAQRVSGTGVAVSMMVWLKAGNVAAYLTSTGDAYLVDLSGSTPGMSKLVVSGPASPGELTPSPNGTSVIVGTFNFDPSSSFNRATLTYVTWSTGVPTSVVISKDDISEQRLHFSFDGRIGAATNFNGASWWDLSSPSPKGTAFTHSYSGSFSFRPNAQAVVFVDDIPASTPPPRLWLGTFDGGGSLTPNALILEGKCNVAADSVRWSPDGKNVLFRCNSDLRGINNVAPSAVGTDFSLLPSGFWSNAFTSVPSVDWSPDSKWVAMRADRDTKAQFDLYLIRWSAAGTAYKAYANSTGSGVATWAFAQNSQTIAFVGTVNSQAKAGLYLSKLPLDGGPTPAALMSQPAAAIVQTDINWLPGSRVIAYRATVAGTDQLFAVSIGVDGSAGNAISISGPSGGVSSYQLAPTN